MNQLSLDFDTAPYPHFAHLGELLKEQGLDDIEVSNRGFLDHARALARQLAQQQGRVSVDDVRKQIPAALWPSTPQAWGGIFRGTEWVHVGWSRSPFPSNHARSNRVWALAD